MTGAPEETEVKFRLADRGPFEERLRELGARPGHLEDEINDLFDDPAGTLRSRGEALRVRTTNGRGILTFKGKANLSEDGVKTRVELETEVESAETVTAILEQLGYLPHFRYEKLRITWSFADPGRPVVVVDETPMGLFAEIEGDLEGVRTLAMELGIPPTDFLPSSYAKLWAEAREKDPWLSHDMTFPRPPLGPPRPVGSKA